MRLLPIVVTAATLMAPLAGHCKMKVIKGTLISVISTNTVEIEYKVDDMPEMMRVEMSGVQNMQRGKELINHLCMDATIVAVQTEEPEKRQYGAPKIKGKMFCQLHNVKREPHLLMNEIMVRVAPEIKGSR